MLLDGLINGKEIDIDRAADAIFVSVFDVSGADIIVTDDLFV